MCMRKYSSHNNINVSFKDAGHNGDGLPFPKANFSRREIQSIASEMTHAQVREYRPYAGAGPISLQEMEKLHVAYVLDLVGWHRGRACEILEISRPRLRRMMREYGLEASFPDTEE